MIEQEINETKKIPQIKRSESMANASIILGITALFTCSCIYLSIVCGSLGIILALLSRGGEKNSSTRAILGLVLSGIGLFLTIAIYFAAFLAIIVQYGSIDNFMQEYMKLYDAETLEELYQSLGIIQ